MIAFLASKEDSLIFAPAFKGFSLSLNYPEYNINVPLMHACISSKLMCAVSYARHDLAPLIRMPFPPLLGGEWVDSKLLRFAEVFVAALGGALLGFSYGMTDMYSKTLGGLGLIEGGTPSFLDIETLYFVERLMSNIFPVSKAYIFGIAGLVIISVGILSAFLAGVWCVQTPTLRRFAREREG